jgi:hypothetical protein
MRLVVLLSSSCYTHRCGRNETAGRFTRVTVIRKLENLDKPTPQQVTAWRAMSPAHRLDIAFQAYQFALDAVRLTERKRHPNLSPNELAWRITRRMQGNSELGK